MSNAHSAAFAGIVIVITLWGVVGLLGDEVTHRELAKIEASRGCK